MRELGRRIAAETFWSRVYGGLTDRFGILWMVNTTAGPASAMARQRRIYHHEDTKITKAPEQSPLRALRVFVVTFRSACGAPNF